MPFKIGNCISFNVVLYFMANLRRTPSAFFTFLLFSFTITLALSMVFRTVGASSRSLVQSLPFSAMFILALMTYTGFVVPIHDMHPWFRWINYIDPIAYAFGPEYLDVSGLNHVCGVVGAIPGSSTVSGSDYIRLSFNYYSSHLWR
jgi:ATP-binding cassette subfamily G (WHITE) protein 2 (PDR)